MIEAGKLRNRASIRRPAETQDDYGQPIKGYSEIGQAWVSVETLAGRELLEARQMVAQADYRVIMRCSDYELKPNDQFWLTCKNLTLEILHINDVDLKGKEFVILCRRNIDV
jgi:SPP1 family predicted phage head-tail adaptor